MAGGTAAPNWANVLVASTVDTVVMDRAHHHILLTSDGTSRIVVTVDGSTPVLVGSTTGYELMPTSGGSELTLGPSEIRTDVPLTLKLISPGTPQYEVVGLD